MLFFFFTALFVTFSASMAAAVPPQDEIVDFTCPFQDQKSGLRCLRDEKMVPRGPKHAQKLGLNVRPDIFWHATKSELASERLCCYELDCLEKCGLFYTIMDNPLVRRLQLSAEEAMDLHGGFFNLASRDVLKKYEHDPNHYGDNLKIILAHFSNVKKEYEDAWAAYRKYGKMLNPNE